MAYIVVSDLSKTYQDKTVFKDIRFSIEQGEMIGIIGASGSGKTTLIQCMLGITKANSGNVMLNHQLMPNLNALAHTGYMAQSDALYDDLTGIEHLKFYASIYKIDKKTLKSRIDEVCQMTDLTKDIHRRVSTYSGGMKRRLSLAICLIHHPELIILDEPTVGIDPLLKHKIWQSLHQLKEKNKTVVITTHLMDEAMQCDKLLLLYQGEMIGFAAPQRLLDYYGVDSIEAIFIKAGGAS
ncbi:ABC transporter ATP-binding protein [Macrococcoides caseolyticum]|uniref:ABC transporter ATP-binding protein n=1 Tax=Macrococcoides caseolyticum TaxID=69966 RepID=UPI001F3CA127|nr:ABC transporter ATP-binding protein [Macrococcus caseolyticus]MCE4955708.1 ABC transporter ATP-binding protein [Macrococcus caseolyticus]